jgi:hypothetical protein
LLIGEVKALLERENNVNEAITDGGEQAG